MAKLSDFMPWIAPSAFGVLEPFAAQHIRDACIEFAEATGVIQTVEPADIVAGQALYELSPPAQSELVDVIAVYYGTKQLGSVPVDMIGHGGAARVGTDTTIETASGTPVAYYQITPNDADIYLWPVPDEAAAAVLTVRASWRPTRTATLVDDVFFRDYAPDIANGALARILAVPGQPFTNPGQAAAFGAMFKAAISNTRAFARRGSIRTSMRVRARSFV